MQHRNGGTLWLRRSYNFIDKDPEIDKFRTIYQKEHIKEDDLAALAGLATGTVKRMFGGDTRRPQHVTYAKMAAAMGYEYGLERAKEINYDREIPVAKEQRKEYRAALAKKKQQRAARKKAS